MNGRAITSHVVWKGGRSVWRWFPLLAAAWLAWLGCSTAVAMYPVGPEITDRYAVGSISIRLTDAFVAPKSSTGSSATSSQVARLNFLRSEPVEGLASQRFFANDMNGTLSIVNRTSGVFAPYLNFDSIFSGTATGDFDADPGYAAGLVTMQFDPDYAANGKFYTVHTELGVGSATAYRQAVLSEWQDADINDSAFAGSRAELLRVSYTSGIHPLGDISFNPAATDPTDPDWRNMYVTSGDGGAGESAGSTRNAPQRLDTLVGKVLRIRTDDTAVTGTYSVPADNPFVATTAGNPAVFAVGLRNPHRLTWDLDDQGITRGFIADIGLHAYEEINLLASGADYGYSRIEGNQVLGTGNAVSDTALPAMLPLLTGTGTVVDTVAPTYPVAMYSHRDGDAISGGFVYRGQAIPALRGRYVFGDITTGRLFSTDLDGLVAANDGDPATMAAVRELNVWYDDLTTPGGVQSQRVFDLVRDRWDLRNETSLGSTAFDGTDDGDALPGSAAATARLDPYGVAYGGGRADIRLSVIDDELYLISKSDGMVRRIVNAMGDADFDGGVGLSDFASLAAAYGGPGGFSQGDFDLNGRVDGDDLRLLAESYVAVGAGDITSAAVATLAPTLATDWWAAIAAVPPPSTITIDVGGGERTQLQAGRRALVGGGSIVKTGIGTLVIDRANTLTGTTFVQAGRLHLARDSALRSSTIVPLAGGTVTLAALLTTTVGGLSPEAGGLVDLGSGRMTVVKGLTAGSLLAALKSGRGDGSWSGTSGITSSVAQLDITLGRPRAIGWLSTGDGAVSFAYAAPGDTNLDGRIDILDAATLLTAGRFDTGRAASWTEGDFDYDGAVDILDIAAFLSTDLFNGGAYQPVSTLSGGAVAVPEPDCRMLMAAAVVISSLSAARRSAAPSNGGRRNYRLQAIHDPS